MNYRACCWAAAATAVLAVAACTPEIDTDPVPVVMEFDPTAKPPRVSEPSFLARDPATGKIDLGVAGIDVPADCSTQPVLARAQCEFNQYLESLDGFPTVATARTPVGGPVDLPTATVPTNVAVIDGITKQPINQVTRQLRRHRSLPGRCPEPELADRGVHLDRRAWIRRRHPGAGQAGGRLDDVQPAEARRFTHLRARHRGDHSCHLRLLRVAVAADEPRHGSGLAGDAGGFADGLHAAPGGRRRLGVAGGGRHPQGAGGGAVGVPGAFQPGDRPLPAGGAGSPAGRRQRDPPGGQRHAGSGHGDAAAGGAVGGHGDAGEPRRPGRADGQPADSPLSMPATPRGRSASPPPPRCRRASDTASWSPAGRRTRRAGRWCRRPSRCC